MENGLIESFLLVAASEMGDKTQLLALILAARFKKPIPIMFGILIATLLNHGLASWSGAWISSLVPPNALKIVLALLFLAFALWILIPDKIEDEQNTSQKWGAFCTTTIVFFLAEMGDKTQLATIALGAQFQSAWVVTTGTTLGMLFSDGLAVVFGEKLLEKVPMKYIRWGSSVGFAVFGLTILFTIWI